MDPPRAAENSDASGRPRAPAAEPAARPAVPADARAEILRAAALTFMERGFPHTSVDDVADTLGATKGRIYHYYRSKSDIVIDIHLESLHRLIERVGPLAARADLDPAERLYRLCHEHVMLLMTDVAFHKATASGLSRTLIGLKSGKHDDASGEVLRLRRAYEDLFARTLADGAAAGIFRRETPRRLTKPLLGVLNWINLWAPPTDDPDRMHEIAHNLATYCVKAVLMAEPERPDHKEPP